MGNTFIGGVVQAGGNTNPSNLLSNLGTLGVDVSGYKVVKDEPKSPGCDTTARATKKMGTWSSDFTVTHIAVWGGNGVAYFDVRDGTFGEWSTKCLLNTGGQQPEKSGVACFGTVTTPSNHTIEIKKVSVGGDGTFNFTTHPSLGFTSLTTVGGTATSGTISKPAGKYTVTETVPSGWDLTDITCTGDTDGKSKIKKNDGKVEIDLDKGENIVCTFTNKKKGSIKIIKDAGGDTTTSFDFEFKKDTAQTFSLKGGEDKTFSNLKQGKYTITEKTLPSGWTLEDIACTGDTDGKSKISKNEGKVEIDLDKGENIVCTFTNKKKGSIKIIKDADGDTTTSFNFEFKKDTPQTFSLTGGTNKIFPDLKQGKYTVTEKTLPSGWTLENIVCEGGSDISVSKPKVEINLNPGETVTCTFKNRRPKGTLKIRKTTIGGDGNFNFSVSGQPGFQLSNGGEKVFTLDVGQYTVEEVGLPNGWILKDATCGQGNKTGNAITVDLDANETIVCTFTNFKEKDDRMTDVTKVFINRRVDNLLSHGPDRARVLRRLDDERGESLKDGGDFEPLKITGQSEDRAADLKITGSLSSLRAAAAAAESQRVKEQAGLEFGGAPYPYGMPTMKQRFDLWVEGQLTSYDDSTGGINREGDFKILYIGADYAITPGILLGALVQIDRTDEKVDEDDLKGNIDGTGWMAGPYLGIKLRDDLFFDARAAWGRSDNDISLTDPVTGPRTGSFKTDRWLASASLTGNYQFGALRVAPQVEIAYGNESSQTYKNSLGQTIDAVDVTIGRLTFGPEFSYRKVTEDGTIIEPHLSIKGIWNFDTEELKLSTGTYETGELRAQIEGGIIVRLPDGYAVRAAGSYDGLGDDDLEAWSFKTWFNMPLN